MMTIARRAASRPSCEVGTAGTRRRGGRQRVVPAVLVLAVGLVLGACAGSSTSGTTTASPDTVPAAGDGSADGSGEGAVQAGAGACGDALREGPLIDPEDSALGAPQPGEEPLPIVDLPRLDTCELGSTADWLGGPLVVNFWASWCGPCREEMPELDDYARGHADEVDLVGVTIDFRQEDAEAFLDEVPVDFPSWFDPDAQVLGREVSVRSMPTTLFVDAEGTIVHRHVGPITRAELEEAVATHLGA